jgi:hypothetical protein
MNMKDEIRALADRYAAELKRSIDARVTEMAADMIRRHPCMGRTIKP